MKTLLSANLKLAPELLVCVCDGEDDGRFRKEYFDVGSRQAKGPRPVANNRVKPRPRLPDLHSFSPSTASYLDQHHTNRYISFS